MDDTPSFWQSLGSGLQMAGGILSPKVYDQQQDLLKQQLAEQNQKRQMIATQLIAGIQSGTVDPAKGGEMLKRLGIPDVFKPDPSVAANQAFYGALSGQGGLATPPTVQGGMPPAAPTAPAAPQPVAAPAQPQAQPAAAPAVPPAQQAISFLENRSSQIQQRIDALDKMVQGNPMAMQSLLYQQQRKMLTDEQDKIELKLSGLRSAAAANKPDAFVGKLMLKYGVSDPSELRNIPAAMKELNANIARSDSPTATMISLNTPSLTPDAIEGKVGQALTGEPLTQVVPGYGNSAVKSRNQVSDAAIKKIAEDMNIPLDQAGQEFARRQMAWHGGNMAYAAVTKDLAAFRPYKNMLDTNSDIAIDLAKKVIKTNSELANRPINALQKYTTDNPDLAEYMAQITIVRTEAARVLNNPRLVGQLTDQAKAEMASIIDGTMPLNATISVLNRLKTDGNNRLIQMETEQERQGNMGTYTNAPQPTSSIPSGWTVKVH